MIPVAIAVTVGKVAYDMHKSSKLDEQANEKMMKSFAKIADAKINKDEVEKTMNSAVLRLINRKKAILSTSMKDFLDLYEKIININFTESKGIKEFKEYSLLEVKEMHTQISLLQHMPAMPVITKNVVVGWLAGGVFGTVTSAIVDDSIKNYDSARIQSKKADVITQQAENIKLTYQAITERVNYITDILTRLNILWAGGLQVSNSIIEAKGTDKKNYTLEDRQSLAACINLAGAIKSLLDTPIIDQDGEITKKSMEVIQFGKHCLQTINFKI